MTTQEALNHFGSGVKLARELKLTPQAIYQWRDFPPVATQYQIEVITKGKLKAER